MDRHFEPQYVRAAYDRFAPAYVAGRHAFDNGPQLESLERMLPRNARVLDLGCGAGVPVARYFADRGHAVRGIDLSPQMIALARTGVPEASFTVGDMCDLESPPGAYELVVCFYAAFHLTREAQLALLPRIREALVPGGHLYVTFACAEYTGAEEFAGTKDFGGLRLPYAHLPPSGYRSAFEASGFVDVRAQKLTIGGETMLWMLGRTPPA